MLDARFSIYYLSMSWLIFYWRMFLIFRINHIYCLLVVIMHVSNILMRLTLWKRTPRCRTSNYITIKNIFKILTFIVSNFVLFWLLLNHKILHFPKLHYSEKTQKLHHHLSQIVNPLAFHFNTFAIIDLESYFWIRYFYQYFNWQ